MSEMACDAPSQAGPQPCSAFSGPLLGPPLRSKGDRVPVQSFSHARARIIWSDLYFRRTTVHGAPADNWEPRLIDQAEVFASLLFLIELDNRILAWMLVSFALILTIQ